MPVTPKRVDTMPEIFVGDNLVTHKENIKYFDLLIDNKLKFQCHIDHVRLKLVQFSGISYRLKPFLNLMPLFGHEILYCGLGLSIEV